MRSTIFVALAALSSVSTLPAQARPEALPTEATRGWAILSEGRVKPLLTYARETSLALTGRVANEGLSALDLVWGYVLAPEDFRGRKYLRVDSKGLKAAVGWSAARKRFSFDELVDNGALQGLVAAARRRRVGKVALYPLDQDALALDAKIGRVADLIDQSSLKIVPRPAAESGWVSPRAIAGVGSYERLAADYDRLAAAYLERNAAGFAAAAERLTRAFREAGGESYPDQGALDRELLYNDLHAFGSASALYLVAFLTLLLFGCGRRKLGYRGALALMVLGFGCHTIGIGLRWIIAGRAPVSDMYESLLFMSWGILGIGLALEWVYRKRFFALAAAFMGFLSLMFAENLPLDSSINPLVPVLANTSWLSIHVMTIMLSYSAFALAMALGHVVLGAQLFRPGRTDVVYSLSGLLHKTLLVGILFLAAGIIFGAIWANESWGRYWGWDPKETWSLITFFVYLAIVHARFAGWLHSFGLAVCAISGFLSVLMTYYGVNFVLGAGLHSYGFASGGLSYVLLYLVLEVTVMVAAAWRYRWAMRQGRLAHV